ncbi:hypothetical protein LA76x_2499 [Lysobacter antibioticus]|uniref:Uncharacterized protein n=1 Tax=Lysobacter antibioticus TaxID=84531 RepID=A0A0S2FAQ9_LYSAN|nr:hypothetical protein LA76x_2499 [Lysobacter antibioticus]
MRRSYPKAKSPSDASRLCRSGASRDRGVAGSCAPIWGGAVATCVAPTPKPKARAMRRVCVGAARAAIAGFQTATSRTWGGAVATCVAPTPKPKARAMRRVCVGAARAATAGLQIVASRSWGDAVATCVAPTRKPKAKRCVAPKVG